MAFERIRHAFAASLALFWPIAASISPYMASFMSISVLRRREITCSSVSEAMLSERRVLTRSDEPSTSVESASRPVSGGKSTSFSCGYCESQERSAPRSTIPICISKIVDAEPCA